MIEEPAQLINLFYNLIGVEITPRFVFEPDFDDVVVMMLKTVLVWLVGNALLGLICAAEYKCNENFPLVTDFSESQCENGEYYDANYYDCFPGCYTGRLYIYHVRIRYV